MEDEDGGWHHPFKWTMSLSRLWELAGLMDRNPGVYIWGCKQLNKLTRPEHDEGNQGSPGKTPQDHGLSVTSVKNAQ